MVAEQREEFAADADRGRRGDGRTARSPDIGIDEREHLALARTDANDVAIDKKGERAADSVDARQRFR